MSSSEKVLLKPFSFQTWPLSARKGLDAWTQFLCRVGVGQVDPLDIWHLNDKFIYFWDFQFMIKHDIFYRFRLEYFPSSNQKHLLHSKLKVPGLNLILWRFKQEFLHLSMYILTTRMKLDWTLKNKQSWFSILIFELHFDHGT